MVKSGTTKQSHSQEVIAFFRTGVASTATIIAEKATIRFADMFTASVFLPELILRTLPPS